MVGCDRISSGPPKDLSADPAVIAAEASARTFLEQNGRTHVELLKLAVGGDEYYFLFSGGGERYTVRINNADGRASFSPRFPW